jgi:glycosyltransferase involved in cell wall biosynthesis
VSAAQASDVSVILCAFSDDRWQDLVAAVESVQRQSVSVREIVVVIDHNADLLARAQRELAGVRVVANAGARGAGEARNTGVRAADGSILAFVDDDVTVMPGWIATAQRAFVDPLVMGVGGTIEAVWDHGPPRWFPVEFNWTVGCTYPGLPAAPAPVRNLIAANMFVRRAIFDALGGFRPGFGKRGARSRPEETDLCLRANQRWPSSIWLYDPAVAVRHRVPVGRGRPRYFVTRCFNEGLGKAALVGYVGSEGLASERTYTTRTLPAGVVNGVRTTLAERHPAGLQRSAAIVVGLGVTAAGYAVGRLAPGA